MPKLSDVNTTDIRAAAELGCRTMHSVFNADDKFVPFFGSQIRPEAFLSWGPTCCESHVTGRHLNALFEARDVFGLPIEDSALANLRHALTVSYSGPVALPMNRAEQSGPTVNFCPHNCREGFHALYPLIRDLNDAEACDLMERNVAAMLELWDAERRWDEKKLEQLGVNFEDAEGFIASEARAIGPLVKIHRVTGHAAALELAMRLKEKAIGEFYLADGTYDKSRFITTHAHSVTCTMSGLAQLAEWTSDATLMTRVKAFFDGGLWDMRDELGWSAEAVGQKETDHGETNNSGDILETALILGRAGYPEYYHDAERIIRGHLLPSQLRDNSFIEDPPNPDNIDGLHNIADRHLGAYGFPAPYGHVSAAKGRRNLSFNMDIVGGTVASLCEAARHIARTEPTGHWVNLLFDHETDAVKVESPYTHDGLTITVKQAGPLFVRIPPWIERDELKIEGINAAPLWTNGYVLFTEPQPDRAIKLSFPLKEMNLTLCERVHVHPIRVKMRGDAVTAMDNFGMDLTFFDPYE